MLFGLGGPAEDATRLYNEARGLLIRAKQSGRAIPVTVESYVTKTMAAYSDYYKKGTYTAEQYNAVMKRAYDYAAPKLKQILTAAPVVSKEADLVPVVEGELNVLGVGIQKKWLVYGGIGLGALVLISFLKGKK
jgi:hypothetical protein